MQELAEFLSIRGIQTVTPLLPGHGSSPDDLAHVSWRSWLETCRGALEALTVQFEDCFVLGHSVGGILALHLASEIPVKGVITLSAPHEGLGDWRLPLLPLVKPFIRHWKKRRRGTRPVTPEMGYDRYPLNGVVECQKLIRATHPKVASVQCPALLIHSRRDHRIPVKHVFGLAKALGSSDIQIRLLNHPAHTVTRGEDKEQVFQAVAGFIERMA